MSINKIGFNHFNKTGPLALLLTLATTCVYWSSLRNGFVWDDLYIIVQNNFNKLLTNAPRLFFMPDVVLEEHNPYYRPLNRLTYLLDYHFYGLNPYFYHLENIIIHCANVLLLFTLLQRLWNEKKVAFFAALLFAVHPINTEAVNFISGRNNLLALFFSLLAFHVYLYAKRKDHLPATLLAAFIFFIGLLSKETALMAGVAMLFTGNSKNLRVNWHAHIRNYLPFILFTLLYAVMRTAALGDTVGASLDIPNLGKRLLQNATIIPTYLTAAFLPTNLNAHYVLPDKPDFSRLAPIWAGIVLSIYFLVRYRTAKTRFGLLWLGLTFIPLSNIVPIPSGPLAERYLYLPAVGFWVLVAEQGLHLATIPKRTTVAASAGLVLFVLLALLTVKRNAVWHDEVSLFSSMVTAAPNSSYAHYNLGLAYERNGDFARARNEWQSAYELNHEEVGAVYQLGLMKAQAGDYQGAEPFFVKSLSLNPESPEANYSMGLLMDKLHRPAEALFFYKKFLQHVPDRMLSFAEEASIRIKTLMLEESNAANHH